MGLFALFGRGASSFRRRFSRERLSCAALGTRLAASVRKVRLFPSGNCIQDFEIVRRAEERDINARRKANGRAKIRPFTLFNKPHQEETDKKPIYDTVGLALSGGGVRSAAFCLGATQAIELADVFKRVDYLSTVSGGGYIGSTITAGMTLDKTGRFPVPSELRADEPPVVQHIRDYSNYLIPHGAGDVVRSVAVYVRGLAANVLLVFPWLIFAAATTIILNPAPASLQRASLLRTLLARFNEQFPTMSEHLPLVAKIVGLESHFIVSMIISGLLFLAFSIWALGHSLNESQNEPEIPGFYSNLFFIFLVLAAIIAFCEIQNFALSLMFEENQNSSGGFILGWLKKTILWLTPAAAVIGLFGNKFAWLVKGVTESSSFSRKLQSLVIQMAMYLAAVIVPLLLLLVYLQLSFWGIESGGKLAAPGWLQSLASSGRDIAPGWLTGAGHWLRSFAKHWINADLPDIQGHESFYVVLSLYLVIFVILTLASWCLEPNANSLHRLYRDRLSKAFLVCPSDRNIEPDEKIETIKHLPLSALSASKAPYHLINAALNIQASRTANRRGRNADFFLFSKEFIGSQTTGYVRTTDMERQAPEVDMATAMAVSGAAAASNMGSSSIKWGSPSLAMLNVRLGYWLRNPKLLFGVSVLWRKVHDALNWYFLYEMLGMLNENRPFVYLSDGGHVENLGVYELLRRRCCVIIVIDGEADPGMHFGSLVRLERYARIDLGIRLELPWQEIREATLQASAEIEKRGDPGNLISKQGPHCAIGTIRYPSGEGRLLYVKSSLTGDESSYVVDYKRRHASFPHETTGDQFFTEEQFEAYRALGFHALQGVFSRGDRISVVRHANSPAPPPAGVPAQPKKKGPPPTAPGQPMGRDKAEKDVLREIMSVLQPKKSTSVKTMTLREPAADIELPDKDR